MSIPVIDVFAGPGGLNEGFSSLIDESGEPVFTTKASIEMDPIACDTLRLRAAVRESLRQTGEVSPRYRSFLRGEITEAELNLDDEFSSYLNAAEKEVHEFELAEKDRKKSDGLIDGALEERSDEPWVLIGGPPCQAYSLAGRSRRTNDESFKDDHKHTLYREYLHIIQKFHPAVFVMENVKGMLSSQHAGGGIFDAIRRDLTNPAPGLEYNVRSFTVPGDGESLAPKDFIIRAEEYGVPQARHRVILLGVRSDIDGKTDRVLEPQEMVTVGETIDNLPKIRSGVSPRSTNSKEDWDKSLLVARGLAGVNKAYLKLHPMGQLRDKRKPALRGDSVLEEWLTRESPGIWVQHESRFHMPADLERYAYLAYMAQKGLTPRVNDLPDQLLPNHRNARRENVPFADRFRVQRKDRPSSTIVSHIAKDGHYFIHYDPEQMRSLSVREAARLQTFPDNYFFRGNRTQQYHQVGNAVPPFLAKQLAEVVAEILGV